MIIHTILLCRLGNPEDPVSVVATEFTQSGGPDSFRIVEGGRVSESPNGTYFLLMPKKPKGSEFKPSQFMSDSLLKTSRPLGLSDHYGDVDLGYRSRAFTEFRRTDSWSICLFFLYEA